MNPIKRMLAVVAIAGVASGLAPAIAEAQTVREAPAALVVVGMLYQKAVFGDDNPKTSTAVGPALGVLFRSGRSGRTALTLEIMAQPNPPINPHFSESFAPFLAMAGAQIGRRTYVRFSGGVTSIGGLAPMIGIAAGVERGAGATRRIAVEVVTRAAGVFGAAGAAMGLQLAFRF